MAFTILRPEAAVGPVRGVLFDMDGVVLDTEKLYVRFWREAAADMGYDMTYAQAMGMRSQSRQEGQQRLEQYFGPGVSHEKMRQRRIARMEDWVAEHGVEPKAGIREMLSFLRQQGIGSAITTSSPMERTRRYLDSLDLTAGFDRLCTAYDVARGKPAPDIYLHGVAALGLRPEQCLALEDSPSGLLSACRAGCLAVLVPDLDPPAWSTLPLLFAQADSLLDGIDLIRALNRAET